MYLTTCSCIKLFNYLSICCVPGTLQGTVKSTKTKYPRAYDKAADTCKRLVGPLGGA